MKRAIIFSALGARSVPVYLQECLAEKLEVTYIENKAPLPVIDFIQAAKNYHFIALTRRALVKLDEDIVAQLPVLEGISTYSTGKEWVDETALAKRQIRLLNLPAYCTNSVAETVLGLVLMEQHKLHLRYLKTMRKIPETISVRGTELIHKRVGILGFGRIGCLVATKIKPLCREVLVHDLNAGQYESCTVELTIASRAEIVRQCTIIVICASQTFEAKEIFTPADYRSLQPDTVVLNVGRKNLLNHTLLIQMVKTKQIRAYIFDDLLQETDAPDAVEYGKIIATGHTAWYTEGAIQNGTTTWINNLLSLAGV